jgi:hypothetical protein
MKKYLLGFIFALSALLVVSAPVYVAAAPADDACEGIKLAGGTCDTGAADSSVKNLVKSIVNILSFVVGAASVIMIIIGGFRYVISGGDSNGVTGAKNTIMYAIIGLVVVLFAQVIVAFVYSNAKSAPAATPTDTTTPPVTTPPTRNQTN